MRSTVRCGRTVDAAQKWNHPAVAAHCSCCWVEAPGRDQILFGRTCRIVTERYRDTIAYVVTELAGPASRQALPLHSQIERLQGYLGLVYHPPPIAPALPD
jgi:hypothetical protein